MVAKWSSQDPKGSVGFINMKGEVVIPLKFQYAGQFSEGLAYAESGGKWGYIDTKGSWVITPRYGKAQGFGVYFPSGYWTNYDERVNFGVGKFQGGYAVVSDASKSVANGSPSYFIDRPASRYSARPSSLPLGLVTVWRPFL